MTDAPPEGRLNIRTLIPAMGIPMLKIRRSRDRLVFTMGIPIAGMSFFILRRSPGLLANLGSTKTTALSGHVYD